MVLFHRRRRDVEGATPDFHLFFSVFGGGLGVGLSFSSYLEKRADFPPGSSSKGAPAPGAAGGSWPEHHPNASYRYPGHFQQQQPMTSTYNMPPRKRSSPSSSVLPPKKQHMDSAGVDYSFHKEYQQQPMTSTYNM